MSTQTESAPLGSVMVVGAGITGMQSALDLANSGYYVYLVEKSPSIGGAMSQLDKTFPTNDCAMWIISPKLVEVGRHINIELLTCSTIEDVQGEEGNFRVKLHSEPRFVDIDKCTGCGDCTVVTLEETHPPREHEGWLWVDRIAIDEAKCTHCGECIVACRKENPERPAMSSVVHDRLEAFPVGAEEAEHTLQKVLQIPSEERQDFWREAFATCIKCYGCIDVCPVHLEEPQELSLASFIPKGEIPPKHPDFHLLRAYQVFDTCVLCAECELTCPADIPLKTLQDLVRYLPPEKVFELVPGTSEEARKAILGFVERVQSGAGR